MDVHRRRGTFGVTRLKMDRTLIAWKLRRTVEAVGARNSLLKKRRRPLTLVGLGKKAAEGHHLNDDKSPLIDLLSCLVCKETMKIEKSAPDP